MHLPDSVIDLVITTHLGYFEGSWTLDQYRCYQLRVTHLIYLGRGGALLIHLPADASPYLHIVIVPLMPAVMIMIEHCKREGHTV